MTEVNSSTEYFFAFSQIFLSQPNGHSAGFIILFDDLVMSYLLHFYGCPTVFPGRASLIDSRNAEGAVGTQLDLQAGLSRAHVVAGGGRVQRSPM